MTEKVHLWLRAEVKPKEHRAAITPSVCEKLLKTGKFKITVESSKDRIFDDSEYRSVDGVQLVESGDWKNAPADAYIVGLKELPEDNSPLSHTHIYFAHAYKGQAGWQDVLGRFVRGNGVLLDLEFLNDEKGRRVAAFGYHAGFAGSALGLDVWAQQHLHPNQEYPAINPFPNESALINHIKTRLDAARQGSPYPRVMVMGALGRCGTGATNFAKKAGIPEENIIKWDINETKGGGPFPEILKSDIFVNCIYLSQQIPPFITKELLNGERNLSVIVDVSCDTTNPYNPIPVYNVCTTFGKPTVPVETKNKHPLEVISIDHLPTLLPRESSEAFCNDLLPSILELPNRQTSRVWQDAERLFREKSSGL